MQEGSIFPMRGAYAILVGFPSHLTAHPDGAPHRLPGPPLTRTRELLNVSKSPSAFEAGAHRREHPSQPHARRCTRAILHHHPRRPPPILPPAILLASLQHHCRVLFAFWLAGYRRLCVKLIAAVRSACNREVRAGCQWRPASGRRRPPCLPAVGPPPALHPAHSGRPVRLQSQGESWVLVAPGRRPLTTTLPSTEDRGQVPVAAGCWWRPAASQVLVAAGCWWGAAGCRRRPPCRLPEIASGCWWRPAGGQVLVTAGGWWEPAGRGRRRPFSPKGTAAGLWVRAAGGQVLVAAGCWWWPALPPAATFPSPGDGGRVVRDRHRARGWSPGLVVASSPAGGNLAVPRGRRLGGGGGQATRHHAARIRGGRGLVRVPRRRAAS